MPPGQNCNEIHLNLYWNSSVPHFKGCIQIVLDDSTSNTFDWDTHLRCVMCLGRYNRIQNLMALSQNCNEIHLNLYWNSSVPHFKGCIQIVLDDSTSNTFDWDTHLRCVMCLGRYNRIQNLMALSQTVMRYT